MKNKLNHGGKRPGYVRPKTRKTYSFELLISDAAIARYKELKAKEYAESLLFE